MATSLRRKITDLIIDNDLNTLEKVLESADQNELMIALSVIYSNTDSLGHHTFYGEGSIFSKLQELNSETSMVIANVKINNVPYDICFEFSDKKGNKAAIVDNEEHTLTYISSTLPKTPIELSEFIRSFAIMSEVTFSSLATIKPYSTVEAFPIECLSELFYNILPQSCTEIFP